MQGRPQQHITTEQHDMPLWGGAGDGLARRRGGLAWRAAAVMALVFAVSGCASHIPPGVAAIDPVMVIATDKTVIDHVAGWTTGEDCSSVRAEQGGHWCVQPYENDPVTQPLYCYRTLGKVSCYAQPSNHPADKLIGTQDGGRQRTW